MKNAKLVVNIIAIVLVIAMFGCILTSCGVKNKIIGEWKNVTSSKDTVYYVLKFYENGTYEKTRYSIAWGIQLARESGNYTIEGNTIRCYQGNVAIVYEYKNGKITTGDYVYVKQ